GRIHYKPISNFWDTSSKWIGLSIVDSIKLPNEPLYYNDTRQDIAFSRWYYTHFPSYLFNIEYNLNSFNTGVTWNIEKFSSCYEEPGVDHRFKFLKKDEGDSDHRCFGALIGPKVLKSPITPDTVLSIPTLPPRPEGYSFIQTLSLKNTVKKTDSKKFFSISKREFRRRSRKCLEVNGVVRMYSHSVEQVKYFLPVNVILGRILKNVL
ncbi:hypothetical protein Avbf_12309, partial [Armadillidium vulgare]